MPVHEDVGLRVIKGNQVSRTECRGEEHDPEGAAAALRGIVVCYEGLHAGNDQRQSHAVCSRVQHRLFWEPNTPCITLSLT